MSRRNEAGTRPEVTLFRKSKLLPWLGNRRNMEGKVVTLGGQVLCISFLVQILMATGLGVQ